MKSLRRVDMLGIQGTRCARVWHFSASKGKRRLTSLRGAAASEVEPDAEAKLNTSAKARHSWKEISQQRLFFDSLGETMGFSSLEDYYSLTKSDIVKAGGSGLLRHYYQQSVASALETIYPEHQWQKWRFKKIPRHLWADAAQVRSFVSAAGEALSISKLDDWYYITNDAIATLGGEALLQHEGSLAAILRKAYPDHVFLEWKFRQVPRSWWSSRENRLTFFKWLEGVLGISSPEDWYQKTSESILELDDATTMLTNYYGNSLVAMLRDLRPQDSWLEWKFKQAPSNFWDSVENQRKFMDHASEALGLRSVQEWQHVTTKQLVSVGGARILKGYQYSMLDLLQQVYPSIEWNTLKSFKPRDAAQTPTAPE